MPRPGHRRGLPGAALQTGRDLSGQARFERDNPHAGLGGNRQSLMTVEVASARPRNEIAFVQHNQAIPIEQSASRRIEFRPRL